MWKLLRLDMGILKEEGNKTHMVPPCQHNFPT